MLNVLNISLSENRRNKTEKTIFEFQKRSFQNEVTVLVLNRRLCFIFYAALTSFSSTRGSVFYFHIAIFSGDTYRTKVDNTAVSYIFTSLTGDGTDRHFTWSSVPRKFRTVCRAKAVPSFLSYFKTPSIGAAPTIEPVTSRSAVKRSTN